MVRAGCCDIFSGVFEGRSAEKLCVVLCHPAVLYSGSPPLRLKTCRTDDLRSLCRGGTRQTDDMDSRAWQLQGPAGG
jgi:hypothetical protein